MSSPLFTILIPTWNSEKYIERAISSIVNNGYSDFEIIVVDNLSNDNTKKIVDTIGDDRIIFDSLKDNSIYEALDRGIKRAKGEIVGWIGCDDQYEPTTLDIIAKAFSVNKEATWATGEGKFLYEDRDGLIKHHYLPNSLTVNEILSANPLISPSTFFLKSFYRQIGGFEQSYKLASDYDLWIRFAVKESPIVIRKSLSIFSYNGNNISSKRKIDLYKETIKILKTITVPGLRHFASTNILRIQAFIIYNRLKQAIKPL